LKRKKNRRQVLEESVLRIRDVLSRSRKFFHPGAGSEFFFVIPDPIRGGKFFFKLLFYGGHVLKGKDNSSRILKKFNPDPGGKKHRITDPILVPVKVCTGNL
jgi:hypothetical protein